jgi:hypothetical protein
MPLTHTYTHAHGGMTCGSANAAHTERLLNAACATLPHTCTHKHTDIHSILTHTPTVAWVVAVLILPTQSACSTLPVRPSLTHTLINTQTHTHTYTHSGMIRGSANAAHIECLLNAACATLLYTHKHTHTHSGMGGGCANAARTERLLNAARAALLHTYTHKHTYTHTNSHTQWHDSWQC